MSKAHTKDNMKVQKMAATAKTLTASCFFCRRSDVLTYRRDNEQSRRLTMHNDKNGRECVGGRMPVSPAE